MPAAAAADSDNESVLSSLPSSPAADERDEQDSQSQSRSEAEEDDEDEDEENNQSDAETEPLPPTSSAARARHGRGGAGPSSARRRAILQTESSSSEPETAENAGGVRRRGGRLYSNTMLAILRLITHSAASRYAHRAFQVFFTATRTLPKVSPDVL